MSAEQLEHSGKHCSKPWEAKYRGKGQEDRASSPGDGSCQSPWELPGLLRMTQAHVQLGDVMQELPPVAAKRPAKTGLKPSHAVSRKPLSSH